MSLIFVDVEGGGPSPFMHNEAIFEFGAVDYETRKTFHGKGTSKAVFERFDQWLLTTYIDNSGSGYSRPIFVSDNPAYDWQFINFYFWKHLDRNPFGHSARRIGDFYAGLCGDFRKTQEWKSLRKTKHDHNPVNDAMGNVEAFERMLKGER